MCFYYTFIKYYTLIGLIFGISFSLILFIPLFLTLFFLSEDILRKEIKNRKMKEKLNTLRTGKTKKSYVTAILESKHLFEQPFVLFNTIISNAVILYSLKMMGFVSLFTNRIVLVSIVLILNIVSAIIISKTRKIVERVEKNENNS